MLKLACAVLCCAGVQPEGLKEMLATIAFYKENAAILKKTFQEMGFSVYGGEWCRASWVKHLAASQTCMRPKHS